MGMKAMRCEAVLVALVMRCSDSEKPTGSLERDDVPELQLRLNRLADFCWLQAVLIDFA